MKSILAAYVSVDWLFLLLQASVIQKESYLGEILHSFIYRNVGEYCSFWSWTLGNDRLATEQQSEGGMI